MTNNVIRLIVLVLLASAAIAVMFVLIGLLFRLLLLGAIVFAIVMLVRNWNRNNA